MIRLPARSAFPATAAPRTLAAIAALSVLTGAPQLAPMLAAQAQPGTFNLPEPTPTPTPPPAGPADERAGVAIPPRAQPESTPTAAPSPVIQPLPTASPSARPTPRPSATASAPGATPSPSASPSTQAAPAPAPAPAEVLPAPGDAAAMPALPAPPPAFPPGGAEPGFGASLDPASAAVGDSVLPDWWPFAAGGLGVLALGGGALAWRRRRKPRVLRLAAAPSGPADPDTAAATDDQPRLDLTLEIVSATRSVMMFTLGWRLTIANRSDRAVNDVAAAVQLACARASGGTNAPSPGAAQSLASIDRIGPHQARSLSGTVQLPLSAITPLRQGSTPLFVPLAHVTLEGEGLRAQTRSFVIGPRSQSGRVHPIALDGPPGGIAGLVAQMIATRPDTAAA